jgi:hypothetical protein
MALLRKNRKVMPCIITFSMTLLAMIYISVGMLNNIHEELLQ